MNQFCGGSCEVCKMPKCYRCDSQPCTCADGITLYNADCLDVLPLLEPGSIDLVLADPPYGATRLHWDKSGLVDWIRAPSYLATGAVVLSFANWKFGQQLCNAAPATLPFRYELVWVKNMPTRPLDANRRPLGNHEFVLVFGGTRYTVVKIARKHGSVKGGSHMKHPKAACGKHYQTVLRTAYRWNPDAAFPVSAMSIAKQGNYGASNGKREDKHPTRKPLEYVTWLTETYSDAGAMVIDPFAGSGTTGRACKDVGRRCILIEIEEKYCALAARRLEQGVLFS